MDGGEVMASDLVERLRSGESDGTALMDEAADRIEALEAAMIEATAELIYLRQHGKDGAVWWANESKEVWREKARIARSNAGVK